MKGIFAYRGNPIEQPKPSTYHWLTEVWHKKTARTDFDVDIPKFCRTCLAAFTSVTLEHPSTFPFSDRTGFLKLASSNGSNSKIWWRGVGTTFTSNGPNAYLSHMFVPFFAVAQRNVVANESHSKRLSHHVVASHRACWKKTCAS